MTLADTKNLRAKVKEILSNIAQANGYNYTVQQVFDRIPITDHIALETVAIGFDLTLATFDLNFRDQGPAVIHQLDVLLFIRNGEKDELYALADDVLRAFHENGRHSHWVSFEPVLLDPEEVFSDEGHFVRGVLRMNLIQPIEFYR